MRRGSIRSWPPWLRGMRGFLKVEHFTFQVPDRVSLFEHASFGVLDVLYLFCFFCLVVFLFLFWQNPLRSIGTGTFGCFLLVILSYFATFQRRTCSTSSLPRNAAFNAPALLIVAPLYRTKLHVGRWRPSSAAFLNIS